MDIHDSKTNFNLISMGADALCRHIPHGRAAVRSAQFNLNLGKIFSNYISLLMTVNKIQTGS